MQRIVGLLASADSPASLQEHLATQGIVGDYALQGFLYGLGGQQAVVLVQIALVVLSLVALFKLTCLLTASRKIASLAALVYLFLPHTLVFPHQLASEGVFVPLIVFSFYFLVYYVAGRMAVWSLSLSALTVGLASLVRPISILWPLVALALAVIFLRPRFLVRHWAGYLTLAFLPVFVWMSFNFVSTGRFTIGQWNSSLTRNLHLRVELISRTLPPAEAARIEDRYLHLDGPKEQRLLGPGQYLVFAYEYPVAFLKHLGRDVAMFLGKSGLNKVILYYLDAFPETRSDIQDKEMPWRRRLEQDGVIALIQYYWRMQAQVVLLTALSGVVFLAFMALATYGAVLCIAGRLPGLDAAGSRYVAVAMAVFPLYILSGSVAASSMQSRHRSPAEFALCFFFAIAVGHVRQTWPRIWSRA
jgi:hypothetical protein